MTKLERLMVRALTRITPLDRPRFDDREKPVLRLIQRNYWRNRERFPGLRPVPTDHLASLVIGTLGQAGSLPIREFHRRCNQLHRQDYGALVLKHQAHACLLEELAARSRDGEEPLRQALGLLDEPERVLLEKRYFGPQTRRSRELAAEYGVSDQAIRPKLARAKRAFQRAYERCTARHEPG